MTRKLLATFALSLAALAAGCDNADPNSLAPIIGQQNAHALAALTHVYNAASLGEKDEKDIGESVGIAITNTSHPVANDRVQRYVMLVGLTVANASSAAGIDWVFGVIESPEINAFSAPHGYVFVTTGALRQMKNEAELAGVLAHEVTHVCNHDGLTQVKLAEQKGALAEGLKAGDSRAQAFSSFADTGFDAITRGGYSQNQESAADQGAVQLLAAAGYDPSAYLQYLQRVQALGTGRGSGGIMSTHPGLAQRIGEVQHTLSTMRPGGAKLPDRFQNSVGNL